MDDSNAVARQVDVELEAIGAARHAVIERGERVLGPEAAPAAMRKDQWGPDVEKGSGHQL
jgi:hypothetical protein